MKNFPIHIILFFSAALALGSAPAEDSTPDKPNVVFILADDFGFMDLGANNPNTFYETPHLDGLAAGGVRFTQAYAATICSPKAAIRSARRSRTAIRSSQWRGSRSSAGIAI